MERRIGLRPTPRVKRYIVATVVAVLTVGAVLSLLYSLAAPQHK
jgi:hypothetical protein